MGKIHYLLSIKRRLFLFELVLSLLRIIPLRLLAPSPLMICSTDVSQSSITKNIPGLFLFQKGFLSYFYCSFYFIFKCLGRYKRKY